MTDTTQETIDRVLYRLQTGSADFDSDDLAQARLLLQTAEAAALDPFAFDQHHALQVLAQIDNGHGEWLKFIDDAICAEVDNTTPLVAAYVAAKVALLKITIQRKHDMAKKD